MRVRRVLLHKGQHMEWRNSLSSHCIHILRPSYLSDKVEVHLWTCALRVSRRHTSTQEIPFITKALNRADQKIITHNVASRATKEKIEQAQGLGALTDM